MAVNNRKSTLIANRDSTPTVPTGATIYGGTAREYEGFVTTGAGDSTGSVYTMVSVPSNSRIAALKLQSAAQGTGCAVNVGVYAPTQGNPNLSALGYAGGAAISAAFFASALSVATAVGVTDITNQSGTNTIALQEQELWQAIGLASDPGCMLDISVALTAATVNAALIGLKATAVQ